MKTTGVKIKIERWLAIKNGISQKMVGKVKAETKKAVLFSGRAYAEETVTCNRCGRNLTHPSSRLVGFGPTCCKKLGIYWPDKDELSESEIEQVKAKIKEVTFEGWLPKSQIEIGDYEVEKPKKVAMAKIGMNARKLKDGTVKIKGIALYSRYEDRHKCREIKDKFGGRWASKKKRWHYPLSIEVVEYAKELWKEDGQELEVSDMLQDWYNEELEKKQNLLDFKGKEDVDPDELNTKLANDLYDFQRVGTHFLTNANGAILGDDMGLGKTLQSIATVDCIGAKRTLIVCPATLKGNWRDEIKKWLPEATVTVVDGGRKKRLELVKQNTQFTIINYASIREKSRKKIDGEWTKVPNVIFEQIKKNHYDVLICDEAHRAKNRKSQQTKALYKIAKNIDKIYHLTGTPIMNRPEEIWSLLHMIDPVKYSSFWRFVNRYCDVYDNGWGKEITGVKNPKEFREMLAPLMLRRRKEEVLTDLPEKTIQKQWVELEGKQKKPYKQMEQEMIVELSEKEVAAPIVIAQMTRLKQIAVAPELMGDVDKYNKVSKVINNSAKLSALMDILDGAGEQKVVIFSQFKTAVKLLEKHFKKEGIDYGVIHGDIPQNRRQAEVNKFQNDDNCKVFLATIKAAGLGLTLTAGSIAVFLDKDWTPANNNQAIDRLYRIGQENNVQIIELLAKNTIEEYIEELLENKQEIFDSLIEGKVTGKEILMNLKERVAV